MECGFGIYCTIFSDKPVCMGQKSTKSQGGTRYLWRKSCAEVASKSVYRCTKKPPPPEATSVFRTVPWDHMGYWASPTQDLFAQRHSDIVCLSGWSKNNSYHFHHVPQISEARYWTPSQTCRKRIALEPSWAILNHLEPTTFQSQPMVTWWRKTLRTFPTNLQKPRRVKAMTPTPWGRRP